MQKRLMLFLMLCLFVGASGAAWGQTSAADWFKLGLETPSPDAKIRAFEQVVQLDPNYLEGYYYLGLAYKSKGRWAEAEINLNKAYFKNPFALNNEIKTRILYELGDIYVQLNNLEKAAEALSGAKELANEKIKGRISYDLGQVYLRQGNILKAITEFQEGKRLWPQNAKIFDEAIVSAEGKKTLDEKYNQSVALLVSERYEDAVNLLTEITKVDPDFKDAAARLQEALALAQQNTQSKKLASLYLEANRKAERGAHAEAIKLFSQIVRVDPNYKDANVQLQKLQNALAQNSQSNVLENYYNRGLDAIQRNSWNEALTALARVARIDNQYRDVQQLLQRVRSELAAQNEGELKLSQLYDEATAASQAGDWQKALAAFTALRDRNPNYRDVQTQIQTARETLARLNDVRIDSVYESGLLALQNGDWAQAVSIFEKVQRLDPTYKEVQNKLVDARFNLNKIQKPLAPPQPSKRLSLGLVLGSTLSIILLPIFGILFFSPVTRARLYLLQGKYHRAAAIYEQILRKDPGRIKLYPLLANIYLLENRRDERAIKIFEMILKLNILTSRKEEINSIMANHYLLQGRTDMNAIQILEKELESKIRKMKVPQ
jgi:tetratricopeptide (TPR) repeat protein